MRSTVPHRNCWLIGARQNVTRWRPTKRRRWRLARSVPPWPRRQPPWKQNPLPGRRGTPPLGRTRPPSAPRPLPVRRRMLLNSLQRPRRMTKLEQIGLCRKRTTPKQRRVTRFHATQKEGFPRTDPDPMPRRAPRIHYNLAHPYPSGLSRPSAGNPAYSPSDAARRSHPATACPRRRVARSWIWDSPASPELPVDRPFDRAPSSSSPARVRSALSRRSWRSPVPGPTLGPQLACTDVASAVGLQLHR